jgi:uroporphyrinogen-III synthase
MPALAEPLSNRVVAIAETRELDVFAALLERRGAKVLRYPLVQIVDAPDPQPVLEWARATASGGLDDLILMTGEGLRRLLSCIDAHEPELRPPFLAALSTLRKITRGPKPARVLRELGLSIELPARLPTTAGVIDTLRALNLKDRRVGVQLYGDDPNQPLIDFLRDMQAEVRPVAPYRYVDGSTDDVVTELLTRMQAGSIDAIAFTSKSQVERLFRAAPAEVVSAALAATRVAAVGPIVSQALLDHGVTVRAMPDDGWFLKPLTSALTQLLLKGGS